MNKALHLLREIGKRLLLLGFALLVSLILMEIILRALNYSPAVTGPLNAFHQADDQLGWIGIPNHSSRFKTLKFDCNVQTNDQGFRAVTANVVPQAGVPEVWLFGDSTSWGWGVSNGELFADVLQEKVGSQLRIRNYAINAYGTVQQYLLLERLLKENNPPAKVIVLVCSNDFSDNISDQGGARPYLKPVESGEGFEIVNQPVRRKIGGFKANLARNSYAVGFVFYCSSLIKKIRSQGKYKDLIANSKKSAEKVPEGVAPGRVPQDQFDAIQFAFSKIDSLCAKNSIALDVISFPQGTNPYIKSVHSKALDEICEKLPTANAVDIESGMTEDRVRFYIGNGDFHWSAAGNRKGAEVLVERLGPRLGL